MHHLLFCMCKPGVYVNKWRVYSSIVSFEYACILKSPPNGEHFRDQ